MNIDNLTFGEIKQLVSMFGQSESKIDNKMVGKYVIVRCRDAGVHAGFLESYNGRECVLTDSRRLWYWKPKDNKKFLSGLAVAGIDSSSRVGEKLPRLHLTENCEIIECTDHAARSLQEIEADES